MAPPTVITFLGTASAVPSQTRNHSSLAVTLPGTGNTYLFDCGEATQHQLQKVTGFKNGAINRIFITHMHGDHLFGLIPLLSTLCNGAGGTTDGASDPRIPLSNTARPSVPNIELFGPFGLRAYIRQTLALTYTHLGSWYVVHELHFPSDAKSAFSFHATTTNDQDELNERELPTGVNIPLDNENKSWRNITQTVESKLGTEWTIDAAPILHSIPCIGYVLTEPPLLGKFTYEYRMQILKNSHNLIKQGTKVPMSLLKTLSDMPDNDDGSQPGIKLPDGTMLMKPKPRRGRKITILGDTYNPAGICDIAAGSDVLIHESTNACLKADNSDSESYNSVESKTISHGHSTPEMAGKFARRIGLGSQGGIYGHAVDAISDAASTVAEGSTMKKENARDRGKPKAPKIAKGVLLLNHFSSRYADPRSSPEAKEVMDEIRLCALRGYSDEERMNKVEETDSEIEVVCSYDLMSYEIRAVD